MPDRPDNACPFSARWEEISLDALPRDPPPKLLGPFPCLCTAGHQGDHVVEIEGVMVGVPKRAHGRPRLRDEEKTDVIWVRLPQSTVKVIEETRGDQTKSEFVRQVIEKALGTRRE